MGVGGPAQRFIEVETESDAIEALRWASEQRSPVAVLGGGSNIVVADEGVEGVVLALRTRGTAIRREGTKVLVTAEAGEPWDSFVALCVAEGFAGLECLSGIPGSVGATPIQNVGAYGQDVSDSVVEVRVYDRANAALRTLDRTACEFGYRDSAFKRSGNNRYVVLSVTFALEPGGAPKLDYAQLRSAVPQGTPASLEETRRIVLELRRSKSMLYDAEDPLSRGCGSFFTNPVVDAKHCAEINRVEGVSPPQWELPGGLLKVPAAWLIERAGYPRGTRRGAVGLSPQHSLAIINCGGAKATQVVAFAREIQEAVLERFHLTLAPEPAFWGFAGFRDGLPHLV